MSAPGATITDSDRLQKLWEAYRVQEEEYQAAVAHAERLARDLEGRDSTMAERERALLAKDAEIARLHDTIAEKDAALARLETLEQDVRAIDAYKDRVRQLEGALAQEKERLAKLFLLYEELRGSASTESPA